MGILLYLYVVFQRSALSRSSHSLKARLAGINSAPGPWAVILRARPRHTLRSIESLTLEHRAPARGCALRWVVDFRHAAGPILEQDRLRTRDCRPPAQYRPAQFPCACPNSEAKSVSERGVGLVARADKPGYAARVAHDIPGIRRSCASSPAHSRATAFFEPFCDWLFLISMASSIGIEISCDHILQAVVLDGLFKVRP